MNNFRIAPYWWPILGLASPLLIPFLIKKNKKYNNNKEKAKKVNKKRIENTDKIDLPEVDFLNLKILVEWKSKKDFMRDSAISYLFETDQGKLLFDIGHGSENKTLEFNADKFEFEFNHLDGLAISHLHKDHMGGMKATRENNIKVPEELILNKSIDCYLPDKADADGLNPIIVNKPRYLDAGITTTGPLARSLFLLGYIEEQSLIINIKGKGLAIFTGCGHPTIKLIIDMVNKLSDLPIYAIGGGFHFPIKEGRGSKAGFELQQIFGTGKPPWEKISIKDLEKTISTINKIKPKKVFLSGHDSCDYALGYLKKNLSAKTEILKAGATYSV